MKMAIVSFVPTVVFLGLAAWPYGGPSPFLRHPARLALVVVAAAALVVASFSNTSGLSSGVREDRRNRWILAPLGIPSPGMGLLPSYRDIHQACVIDGDTARYIGVAFFAIGLTPRLAPTFALGRRFSRFVAIQPIILSRQKAFTATFDIRATWDCWCRRSDGPCFFRSPSGMLLVLGILGLLVCRMNAEEKLLAGQFGESYDFYRRHTWRLFPYLY